MKKKKYVKPETGHITVELEGTICGSILDKERGVVTKGHEVGKTYEFANDGTFTDSEDPNNSPQVTW